MIFNNCNISIIFIILILTQVYSSANVNHCDVLEKSLMFYKAQRAGKLPDDDIPWRGDSVLGDGDFSGGYFDAGDHVKFALPMAYSLTMLGWSFIQYESNIKHCGLTSLFLEDIKWGTDWLIAAHTSENEFVGQVGDGDIDHQFWGPPEMIPSTTSRPVFKLTTSKPGTEVAMEAASALSAASIIWKTRDPSYSSKCLTHAKQLYSFGDTYRGVYSDSIPNAQSFYKSWSGFNDELVWGSIWLYKATSDSNYLNKAKQFYTNAGIANIKSGTHDWDNKGPGCSLLLFELTKDDIYKNAIEGLLNSWLPGGGVTYTPGGLAWFSQWGTNRYTSTIAYLTSIYSGYNSKYSNFTRSQISYMLGDNPLQISYVIGVTNKFPINPHHRASHHSTTNNINVPTNNVYQLTGALVGGPGQNDDYTDNRSDYVKNEVACDYNAGFTGAIASLVDLSSTPVEPGTESSSNDLPDGLNSGNLNSIPILIISLGVFISLILF